jgi:hypothetical protein
MRRPQRSSSSDGARAWYEQGVASHYHQHATDYRNPHEPIVHELLRHAYEHVRMDWSHVLDLAAGSGEVTRGIRECAQQISAADPFTHTGYTQATGLACREMSFEQIANGQLEGERFSIVICSFAMHLCALSVLPQLSLALARVSPTLVILTPHKRPILKPAWGWTLHHEHMHARVRLRVYRNRQ